MAPNKSIVFNIFLAIVLTILSLAIVIAGIFYYLATTTQGAKAIVEYIVKQQPLPVTIQIADVQGTLAKGLILKNVTLFNLPRFPSGTTIVIQEFYWRCDDLLSLKSFVRIFDGRLNIPNMDSAMFSGIYENNQVTANLYGNDVNIYPWAALFLDAEKMKYLSGFLQQVDLDIKGTLKELVITGAFIVDKIKYKATTVQDGAGRVALKAFNNKSLIVKGNVGMADGNVLVRNRSIDLMPSRVIFKEDLQNPDLAINGQSQVEDVDMNIRIRGTLKNPELKLDSDPPLAENMLLIMLATGKRWLPDRQDLSQDRVAPQLVGDFLDYFLLKGEGGKLAKQYGFTDFRFQYDQDTRKFGVAKKVIDGFKIGVEVEELPGQSGQANAYSQKLEGEVSLSKNLSVNVSQKTIPQERSDKINTETSNAASSEGEILLKYKKRF